MRVKVLLLGLVLGVVGYPRLGEAEKVRTNQKASVFNRPGEQGKVVVKVKEGQAMTVLAKEGRWLKVRVSGRTGYVPRSKVDMSSDEDIPRNTRRRAFVDGRSKKRGFGGEDSAPEDRIAADAIESSDEDEDEDEDDEPVKKPVKEPVKKPVKKPVKEPVKTSAPSDDDDDDDDDDGDDDGDGDGDDEPADDDDEPVDTRVRARVSSKTVAFMDDDDDSDEAFEAKPSDVLFVERTRGKWTEVSVEDGDIGWIRTAELELEEAGGGAGSGGRRIDVRARLGVMFVSQSVASAGGTQAWPDRYRAGSSAAAVAVGGTLLYPYKKRFVVGGELAYDLARAVPGIAFDPDGAAGPMEASTTGFTLHNVNLRAIGGFDLKKRSGAMVFARLGYHYESFQVANYADLTKNTARLPSEIISGPMLGAAFAMPRLTDKLGLDVRIDAMVVGGSVEQTKNLEHGADPSVTRVTFGTAVTYRWKPAFDLQATYDLNYGSLRFGAPPANSMRGQTGTSATRSDLHHTVAIGIAKGF